MPLGVFYLGRDEVKNGFYYIYYTKKGSKAMKKTFMMEDLDCANCARKMEEAIAKLDGVQ